MEVIGILTFTLKEMEKRKFVLVIHGGVGTILPRNMTIEKEKAYRDVLIRALSVGERILKNGKTAVEAVEAAIVVLENIPLFNAGRGSVFTYEGENEMDASIMDGLTLNAGAVAGVKRIKNPITAARKVMENSPHVMLIGKGAEKFAKKENLRLEKPSYFYSEERYQQLMLARENNEVILDHSGENKSTDKEIENNDKKLGTVGAVALDRHGNLAAATSTGGMTNKRYGRVGDTPIIGAGTYAKNNTCAVSGTGHGEYFLRNVVAYDISALIEYKGKSLKEAVDFVIHKKLKGQNGEAGVIALDKKGNYEMTFNTEGMYRGIVSDIEPARAEIFK
ncbi:isoaspartyl peptidase/L-asparaginase family protein [Psychroflexus montanilacus]|uniref:isoaspartyl peptidase/L-asparaginase family protein n=1 Tax=Psychroflexus montanilacus TaxID=2873598 RepID=UPI001CCF7662|nr:isoaspartyl peptidase/L-asparaginase [Psychroflexus montanilacus]MBZ9650940.1 isoaspartyl peptidase/L-asparaginase [Psychroflexus montanilacus]